MPNIQSAAKRLRQSIKRQMFNRMRKSRVKTSEVSLDYILSKKDDAAAVAAFAEKYFPKEVKKAQDEGKSLDSKCVIALALSKCFSELDKAQKVGVIHKNKADRKKSRLVARVSAQG